MIEIKLQIEDIVKDFAGIRALDNISFEMSKSEILGLIGPNGSGKTTLVNLIGGALIPTSGNIYYQGERIDGLRPYEIAKKGIGRTFQITQVFRRMTVLENLLIPGKATFKLENKDKRSFVTEKALEILSFLEIDRLKNEYARNLSGGQQKLLELGRVLMLDPNLIALDEPFAGVHPNLREKLYKYITEIHENGKSFIIISHDMDSIFALSQRIIVLGSGEKIADDMPQIVKEDKNVLEAYLGLAL